MSTEKDIRQFIHYYLGCKVRYKDGTALRLKSVSLNSCRIGGFDDDVHFNVPIENFKLCLSRLEDITEDEEDDFMLITGIEPEDTACLRLEKDFDGEKRFGTAHLTSIDQWAKGVDYLRSKGYWIGGNDWFDEGIIIDKKTMQ